MLRGYNGGMDTLREFWTFLRARKKFWLLPIVLLLFLLGGLLMLQGTAIGPLIYTIF